MVIIFYLANLLAGLIIMIPFRSLAGSIAGYSLIGKDLANGLNMDFIIELLIKSASAFDTATGLLLLLPSLYWLWTLFISGGAYGIFIHGKSDGGGTFWSYSAKYFGRLFRFFLWSIPVFLVLYLSQFILAGIKFLIWGSDPYQYVNYWTAWIRFGWTQIAFLIYFLMFDYGRIILISNDERRTRRALWQGIRFSLKHPLKTFALSFIIFLLSQAFFLAYVIISPLLGAPNTFALILLLVAQQIYIFIRMTLRLTLYSAQTHLFKTNESREYPESGVQLQPYTVA